MFECLLLIISCSRNAASKSRANSSKDSLSDGDEVQNSVLAQEDEAAALQRAVDRLNAEARLSTKTLKRTWKEVISTYCRKRGSLNFPQWALDTIGEPVILKCLDAEFGGEKLASFLLSGTPGHQAEDQQVAGEHEQFDPSTVVRRSRDPDAGWTHILQIMEVDYGIWHRKR